MFDTLPEKQFYEICQQEYSKAGLKFYVDGLEIGPSKAAKNSPKMDAVADKIAERTARIKGISRTGHIFWIDD